MEMRKSNHRNSIQIETYVKNLKGENHGARYSSIIMAITMVILWCARILGLS